MSAVSSRKPVALPAFAALAAVGLTSVAAGVTSSAANAVQLDASAPATATAKHCSGVVNVVDAKGTLKLVDAGTSKLTVRHAQGKLGYTPRAIAMLGEDGDPSGFGDYYLAVTPSGQMRAVTVTGRQTRHGYRTAVHQSTIGRGFGRVVSMAGSADGNTPGHVYTMDTNNRLIRYSYQPGGKLTNGRVVAHGAGIAGLTKLTFVTTTKVNGVNSDVLLGAYPTSLEQINVPTKAPAEGYSSSRASGNWAANRALSVLRCDGGTFAVAAVGGRRVATYALGSVSNGGTTALKRVSAFTINLPGRAF